MPGRGDLHKGSESQCDPSSQSWRVFDQTRCCRRCSPSLILRPFRSELTSVSEIALRTVTNRRKLDFVVGPSAFGRSEHAQPKSPRLPRLQAQRSMSYKPPGFPHWLYSQPLDRTALLATAHPKSCGSVSDACSGLTSIRDRSKRQGGGEAASGTV